MFDYFEKAEHKSAIVLIHGQVRTVPRADLPLTWETAKMSSTFVTGPEKHFIKPFQDLSS